MKNLWDKSIASIFGSKKKKEKQTAIKTKKDIMKEKS